MKFNEEKLAKLKRADEWFDERYGKPGTQSRTDFENKALAWYYGEVLRDKRKELKITQKQLAEKISHPNLSDFRDDNLIYAVPKLYF